MYFTLRNMVSGCGFGSFTQISRLSWTMLNCVMRFSGATPRTQIESICAYGAMKVMYAVLSPTRSLFTIICFEGFSLNTLSSNSVFLARQFNVSVISYFWSSGSESTTTVIGLIRVSINATFSDSGSYLLLLFSSMIAYILYTVSWMFLRQKKPHSSVFTAASGRFRKRAESA